MRRLTKQTDEWNSCDVSYFQTNLNQSFSFPSQYSSLMESQTHTHAQRHRGIHFTPVLFGCELALNPPILRSNECIIW